MKTNRIVEVAVKVIVAALTAFLTAITTTSCMGHGPIALWAKLKKMRLPKFGGLIYYSYLRKQNKNSKMKKRTRDLKE